MAMARTVRIIERREVFHRYVFRIDEVKLQYERYDGSMSEPITRLVLNRGDSVAILLHNVEEQSVLLSEQFRAPTYEHGSGWLLELPAGIVDAEEEAEVCARRETLEETGYSLRLLERIGCVYLSPGGSSERIHIFYSEVKSSDQTGKGGGLIAESEDISLVTMSCQEAIAKARRGEIQDAKTLIALQWLELAQAQPS